MIEDQERVKRHGWVRGEAGGEFLGGEQPCRAGQFVLDGGGGAGVASDHPQRVDQFAGHGQAESPAWCWCGFAPAAVVADFGLQVPGRGEGGSDADAVAVCRDQFTVLVRLSTGRFRAEEYRLAATARSSSTIRHANGACPVRGCARHGPINDAAGLD